jgi:hypothetical protein
VLRPFLVAPVVVLALVASAAAVLPAAAETRQAVVAHKLIVAVEKKPPRAAGRKLAFLVLVRRDGGAPAGAVATQGTPLTVLLADSGLYRVKAELDLSCRGSCTASARISGEANHELVIVPTCRREGSGFSCSKVKLVKVY